jgi:hypothetical protein
MTTDLTSGETENIHLKMKHAERLQISANIGSVLERQGMPRTPFFLQWKRRLRAQ